jgi:hypothetical protein
MDAAPGSARLETDDARLCVHLTTIESRFEAPRGDG